MNLDERDRVTDQFGAAPEQVERDHLISLLLAYLSEHFADRLHFIGGTALARTHLPHGRLSEDIDLISLDPRRSTLAADLDEALPRALQRAYGRLDWAPPLSAGTSAVTLGRMPSGNTPTVQPLAHPTRPSCGFDHYRPVM
ncbi:nucleotidyl transferase AbiEii/AbiGii toxin family protein [Rhodococcus sp. A14]|uniref:nucleotidyl transferase AbiEii/AbiGii toxin family protein n=1 Tax=Rhodococcus sp. A14 TaxID=1194106 RepID=UPI001420FED2|nr:nucleotidyl transferase AbiEii/AbiGii toxin family protein [Rhodococcus sp. A14]